MMDHRKIAALSVTVIVHIIVVLVLIGVYLRYSSAEQRKEWPPVDSAEILFGGEYVMVGNTPEPNQSGTETSAAESTPEPAEEVNAPMPAKTPAATEPQPMKAVDAEEQERREREAQQRAEAADNIRKRVTFGQDAGAQTGSPDGNSTTGKASGIAAEGLGGRKAIDLPSPPRGPLGTITVSIRVNRSGAVTAATFLRGTGAAAADEESRRQCIAAARNARFEADRNAAEHQSGTLTYRFR